MRSEAERRVACSAVKKLYKRDRCLKKARMLLNGHTVCSRTYWPEAAHRALSELCGRGDLALLGCLDAAQIPSKASQSVQGV